MRRAALFSLVVVALLISLFYFFSRDNKIVSETPSIIVPAIIIEDRVPPKDFSEYQNKKYRFSIFFPKELSMTQYSVPGDGQNIIFETKDGKTGFQIFIVGYDKDYITEERFKMDVPSGLKLNPVEISIDGKIGTTFTSNNPEMGDTQEVWVINNGYLYEVVTYKSLENMLVDIVTSWRFY